MNRITSVGFRRLSTHNLRFRPLHALTLGFPANQPRGFSIAPLGGPVKHSLHHAPVCDSKHSKPPVPTEGFYQRPLPSHLIPYGSTVGRNMFREAMNAGDMEGYFALAAQFQTQSEPAYCGPSTLAMVLNAMSLDPNRVWKAPWRWYSEEMLSSCDPRKPSPLHTVQHEGMSFEEFVFMAECNGAGIQSFRGDDVNLTEATFRDAIKVASTTSDQHLVVAFSRKHLGQTGEGHYSPIAGYHAGKDMVLILDVARFKYPPYWVHVPLLWKAVQATDPLTARSRGFFIFSSRKISSAAATSFTPLNSSCQIAVDKASWQALAHYFCRTLPVQLQLVTPMHPERVFAEIFNTLPVDLKSIFSTYSLDLTRRLKHQGGARIKGTALSTTEPLTASTPALAQISKTKLYALVSALIRDQIRDNFAFSQFVSDELEAASLGTLLLLACPMQAFGLLPPSIQNEIATLRALEGFPPTLMEEVSNLRSQMGILAEHCLCTDGTSSSKFSHGFYKPQPVTATSKLT